MLLLIIDMETKSHIFSHFLRMYGIFRYLNGIWHFFYLCFSRFGGNHRVDRVSSAFHVIVCINVHNVKSCYFTLFHVFSNLCECVHYTTTTTTATNKKYTVHFIRHEQRRSVKNSNIHIIWSTRSNLCQYSLKIFLTHLTLMLTFTTL